MQNKTNETPIIISAKNLQENNIYYLKSINARCDLVDNYGNTVYHYICLNELCIGIEIINNKNYFNYTPSDYCKISLDYYYFK